jgi:hypothetical protein
MHEDIPYFADWECLFLKSTGQKVNLESKTVYMAAPASKYISVEDYLRMEEIA